MVRRHLENSNVPQLESPAWVSQREAARELNVAVLRIGLLIANEHLEAAEDLERNMGVTRISLDAERRWRARDPSGCPPATSLTRQRQLVLARRPAASR